MPGGTVSLLAAACAFWLSLSGCRCGKTEPAAGAATAAVAVADRPAILATLPDGAPAAERQFFFAERGGAVAWVDEEGGAYRVVLNGRAGKAYAAVGTIALSPDGRRLAYAAQIEGAWRMVVDGAEGKGHVEVQGPVFSPDGARLAYQAKDGKAWHVVVDGAVSGPSRTPCQGPEFSADSKRIAFLADVDELGFGRLVVSDLAFASPQQVEARAADLRASEDRVGVVAIAASGQKVRAVAVPFNSPGQARRGPIYDAIWTPVLGRGGAPLAYLAERGGQRYTVVDEQEEPLQPGEVFGPPVIRPGKKALGLIMLAGGSVRLHQAFAPGEPDGAPVESAETLTSSSDGSHLAYVAQRKDRWFLVVDGKEGPSFDRAVAPRFTPDGRFLVYRARQDGKRFVVVADTTGKTVRQHPGYEQVFQPQFTADGKSVAYGVKDGLRLRWVVEPL